MTELKPCPFCGSDASEWFVAAYSLDSSYDMFGCAACNIGFDTGIDQETIDRWNTRADTGLNVKPLEWRKDSGPDNAFLAAACPFGMYYIVGRQNGDMGFRSAGSYDVKGLSRSLEGVKAAAQADYERRILSAIELAPASGRQPIEAATIEGGGE